MNTITLGIRGHLYQGAFSECKVQSYVASVSDLIIVWRGFRETITSSLCPGNEREAGAAGKRYLPAEKNSYLSLRFYETYL